MGAEKHCRRQRRQASQRTPAPQVQPVPPPAQARGCKGRSPLHEITLIPPLPAGKGGGGIGAKSKAKGRVCRRHRRHAPFRHHSGKKPLIHRRRQEAKSPEPGTCADSGQQKMSREKFWGSGGLFQESPGVSPITGSAQTATLPDRRWRRGNRCGRGRYRLRRGTPRCRWRRSRHRCRGTVRRAR